MGALKRQAQAPMFRNEALEDDVTDSESDYSESESEMESEEEEDEDVKLAEPSKTSIYNGAGLLEQLADLSWPENVDWSHKLTVDIEAEEKLDVNDDLARELAFYNQALLGTRKAFEKIQSTGLPFLRPSDYYAEMVKTDSHMVKVKGRLLEEKKRIEESEERRKAREAKKIAKEVQSQKVKEKAKRKKEDFESVKKWRKQRQQSGFADKGGKDDDMGFTFEEGKGFERTQKKRPGVGPGDRSGGKARQLVGKGKKGGDKKRSGKERRDSKFGFGGKKGMKKQNTAESTDDFRGFNKGGDSSGNKRRKK